MKLQVTIVFLVIANLTFAQKNFKKYAKENIAINYPDSWRLDVSGQMNTEFILFSELEENDTFQENINLLKQDLKGQGFTMESYVKLSKNQIKKMVPNGKIIESKYVNDDQPHYVIIWSGFVSGNNLKFKQLFFLENENAYVLTFTTLPETFDQYIDLGNKILNSFKLKK